MKFLKKIAILAILSTIFPLHAQAQSIRIAAVVNEDIITVHDIAARIRLTLFTTKRTNPDKATFSRIQKEVLRNLIDERLKIQTANSSNITIPEGVIDSEIVKIERRNNLPPKQLLKILAQNQIDVQTLRDQVRAQLAWQRFVTRQLRRKIRISEEQVDDELDLIASQSDKLQKRVFEIFLPIESVEQEADARANILEIRKSYENGSAFSTLARAHSKSSTSALGGDRGWLSPGQLSEDLDEALQSLAKGQVSQPVETLTGIYLFYVSDERKLGGDKGKTELSFVQLNTAKTENAATIFDSAREEINSCEASESFAQKQEGVSAIKTAKINLEDLSDALRSKLEPLKANQTSEAVEIGNNLAIFTICNRKEPKSNLPSRRDVRNQILESKLDVSARQHLRDLRNSAFVDIRG